MKVKKKSTYTIELSDEEYRHLVGIASMGQTKLENIKRPHHLYQISVLKNSGWFAYKNCEDIESTIITLDQNISSELLRKLTKQL